MPGGSIWSPPGVGGKGAGRQANERADGHRSFAGEGYDGVSERASEPKREQIVVDVLPRWERVSKRASK